MDEGPNKVRDRYHGELLAVQELCDSRGWVFSEQMRWACRALRTVVANEDGRHQPLDEDGRDWWPDEDELEEGTPGVLLMGMLKQPQRGTGTMRTTIIKKPLIRIALVPMRKDTPTRKTIQSTRGRKINPSVDEILALAHGQTLTTPAGASKYSGFKVQVYKANGEAKKRGLAIRCRPRQLDNGTMVVERVE